MHWTYIFWTVVHVAVVGDADCHQMTYRTHGTIGFASYGECERDGKAIALSGFENYRPVELQGGCFRAKS